jgi:hypothetical protein
MAKHQADTARKGSRNVVTTKIAIREIRHVQHG